MVASTTVQLKSYSSICSSRFKLHNKLLIAPTMFYIRDDYVCWDMYLVPVKRRDWNSLNTWPWWMCGQALLGTLHCWNFYMYSMTNTVYVNKFLQYVNKIIWVYITNIHKMYFVHLKCHNGWFKTCQQVYIMMIVWVTNY